MVAELIVIEQELPVLPTVADLLALVEQADGAAAEAQTYIARAYVARALYWAREAQHAREVARERAANVADRPAQYAEAASTAEYWAERSAGGMRTAARRAAYAAKRARYWMTLYARQVERAAR